MPRREKGILGVKRDPKNQILFSFNVRDGEEMPSDSEDSDYNPGHASDSDQEPGTSKTGKRKSTQKAKTTMKCKPAKRSKMAEPREGQGDVGMRIPGVSQSQVKAYTGQVAPLPTEIWLKIFHYATQTEGAIPFLLHAERVSRHWKEVCCHPGLWDKVDLSYGWIKFKENNFRQFCQKRLTECSNLSVSAMPVMAKLSAVKAIADHCQKLRTINLSRCNKLPSDSVITIVNSCKLLEDIDLSGTTADAVSSQTLCHVIDKCGANLRRLNLSNNLMKGFSAVFNALMDKCPLLEELDISNVNFSNSVITLDIERFQRSCPRLRTLGLANSSFRASPATQRVQEESPGFPALEEISLATLSDSAITITDDIVLRLLKTSDRLRLLDLRGCRNVAAVAVLSDLPATHLEQLHLCRSAVASCHDLHNILAKWRNSLTDLDLSWNNFKSGILELGLVTVCGGQPPATLVNLNLAGTSVTMDLVRKLLNSLPSLTTLDLTSCRDVSRGCKREYKTRAELDSLRDNL